MKPVRHIVACDGAHFHSSNQTVMWPVLSGPVIVCQLFRLFICLKRYLYAKIRVTKTLQFFTRTKRNTSESAREVDSPFWRDPKVLTRPVAIFTIACIIQASFRCLLFLSLVHSLFLRPYPPLLTHPHTHTHTPSHPPPPPHTHTFLPAACITPIFSRTANRITQWNPLKVSSNC